MFKDYSRQLAFPAIAATRTVLVLPPRLSCSRRVSLDSLKGAMLVLLEEARVDITFPRVVKDKFIFFSSSKCAVVIV